MNVSDVKDLADRIRAEIGKAVVGQADTVDLMLTALFAGGHVLLEGPPGTAKTFLAQCFARTLGLDFGRIQFTPDLMPGDIIGRQPVQLPDHDLHADPRADLLRAAAGRRDQPHAAQDPGRAAGGDAGAQRHPRRQGPPAQRALHGGGDPEPDRAAGHLSAAGGAARPLPVQADPEVPERGGGAAHRRRARRARPAARTRPTWASAVAADRATITAAIAAVSRSVRLADEVVDYVVGLVRATRETPDLETGASPRSGRDAGHRRARPGRAARAATT